MNIFRNGRTFSIRTFPQRFSPDKSKDKKDSIIIPFVWHQSGSKVSKSCYRWKSSRRWSSVAFAFAKRPKTFWPFNGLAPTDHLKVDFMVVSFSSWSLLNVLLGSIFGWWVAPRRIGWYECKLILKTFGLSEKDQSCIRTVDKVLESLRKVMIARVKEKVWNFCVQSFAA